MTRQSRLKRRFQISLVLAVLCISAIGATGCTVYGDSIRTPDGKTRLGEWTLTSGGILAVLYRRSGAGYVGASQVLLDWYRGHRRYYSVQVSSILTMRQAKEFCGSGYNGDACRWALRDEEWSDFRDDSLVPIASTAGECIAVLGRHSGTNWTTRSSSDKHCRP